MSAKDNTVYIGPNEGLYVIRFRKDGSPRKEYRLPKRAVHPPMETMFCLGNDTVPVAVHTRVYPVHGETKGRMVVHGLQKVEVTDSGMVKWKDPMTGHDKKSLHPSVKDATVKAALGAASRIALDSRGPLTVLREDGLAIAESGIKIALTSVVAVSQGALKTSQFGVVVDAVQAAASGDKRALVDVAITGCVLAYTGIPLDVSLCAPHLTTSRVGLFSNEPMVVHRSTRFIGLGTRGLASGGVSSISQETVHHDNSRTTENRVGVYGNIQALAISADVGLGTQTTKEAPVVTEAGGVRTAVTSEISKVGIGGSINVADRQEGFFRGMTSRSTTETVRTALGQDSLHTRKGNASWAVNQGLAYGTGEATLEVKMTKTTEISEGIVFKRVQAWEAMSEGKYSASSKGQLTGGRGTVQRKETGTAQCSGGPTAGQTAGPLDNAQMSGTFVESRETRRASRGAKSQVTTGEVSRTVAKGKEKSLHEEGRLTYREEERRENGMRTREGTGTRLRERKVGEEHRVAVTQLEEGTYRDDTFTSERRGGIFSSSSSSHGRVEWGEEVRLLRGTDENGLEVVLFTPQVHGSTEQVTNVSRNLLFASTTAEIIELDGQGKEISRSKIREFELSDHSRRALSSAKSTATTGLLLSLVNTKEGKPTIGSVAVSVAVSGSRTFATSVASDLLAPSLGTEAGGAVAGAGVGAVYNLVAGDHKAALKQTYMAAVNYALEHGVNLPLTVGRTTLVSNGRLFGSRVVSDLTIRDHLDMNFCASFSAGIHFEQTKLVHRTRDGYLVERRSHGVGAHASVLGIADLSGGLHSGFEASDILQTTEGDFLISRSWDRTFKGELSLSLRVGDRQARVNLPAWKSTKRTYTKTERADGKPLSTKDNLPNRYLPNAPPSGPGGTTLVTTGVKTHDEVASSMLPAPKSGRSEKINSRVVEKEEKTRLFKLIKKTKHHTLVDGTAVEVFVSTKDGKLASGAELFTETVVSTAIASFHERDGKRISEMQTLRVEEATRVTSKTADGATFADRSYSNVDTITRTESDMHELRKSETVVPLGNGSAGQATSSSSISMVGRGMETEERKILTSTTKNGSFVHEELLVSRADTYVDLREDQGAKGCEKFAPGVSRVAAGIESRVTQKTDANRGSGIVNRAMGSVTSTVTVEEKHLSFTAKSATATVPATPPTGAENDATLPTPPPVMERTYGEAQLKSRTTVKREIAGIFDKTSTTVEHQVEGSQDLVVKSNTSVVDLNAGAKASLSIAVSALIQIIIEKVKRYQTNKDLEKKGYAVTNPITIREIFADFAGLAVQMGETYSVTMQTQAAAITKALGDAAVGVILTLVISTVLRLGLQCGGREADLRESGIDFGANLARAGLTLLVASLELSHTSPILFAVNQCVSGVAQFAKTIRKEGLSLEVLKKAGMTFVVDFGLTALATAAAVGAEWAATAGLMALGVVNPIALTVVGAIIVPGLVFMGVRWLWSWWYGTPEQRRFAELLAKYSIPKDGVTVNDLRAAFRKAALEAHPDKKGGSKERFETVAKDFEEMNDLASKIGERPPKGSTVESISTYFTEICQKFKRAALGETKVDVEKETQLLIDYNPI